MSNKMALDARGEIRKDMPSSAYKLGDEFKPFHPSASHVRPEWRDGWNACFIAAIAALQAQPQPAIPEGWGFSTADFSLQANGISEFGGVMLVRTGADRAYWHFLDDEQKEDVPLYVSGIGRTVAEAIANAAKDCAPIPALPKD